MKNSSSIVCLLYKSVSTQISRQTSVLHFPSEFVVDTISCSPIFFFNSSVLGSCNAIFQCAVVRLQPVLHRWSRIKPTQNHEKNFHLVCFQFSLFYLRKAKDEHVRASDLGSADRRLGLIDWSFESWVPSPSPSPHLCLPLPVTFALCNLCLTTTNKSPNVATKSI